MKNRIQVNARIPESLREEYYKKCDKEGQVYTTTLAILLEAFVDEEYEELWNSEEGE